MCENSGPRGTRPVFSSTGMWCSPSITTASGRPERPWTLETKSFGFSAAESMYTRSPSRSYAARVDAAIWSAPMDRYRKTEAPMSHRRARASKPCARASFCTPWRETAAVAMTAADMAVARMTRSEIRLSCGVGSRPARRRQDTAARSQRREVPLRGWEAGHGALEGPPGGGGGRPALPVGVERGFEPAREFGVLDDDADLAILRPRPEAPVQAGHEHLTAVHDDPLVVEPFDRAARLEQTRLQRESAILRLAIDPADDALVRPGIGFDGR